MPTMDAEGTVDRLRVAPKQPADIARRDSSATPGAPGKEDATDKASEQLRLELEELQLRLYAEAKRSILVVFQAMDAGGKDGAIKKVFSGVNPQGCRVTSFKAPSDEERAHDFLWRVHHNVPRVGEIGIFNRSHYEDVLVVRVHKLVPKTVWSKRYAAINAFESELSAAGTTIVKFFLHISKEEQAERFRKRIAEPQKNWKFNRADVEERQHWSAYEEAFEDAITKTSTAAAPWYVVPADHKWYRDWAVLTVLVETLRAMDPQYPEPALDLADVVIE
jgi:PPK2 family polyphosphate:nucleotide phosphotransferase